MPWVLLRQASLNQAVVNSWIAQGIAEKSGIHIAAAGGSGRIAATA
jgi:hypothetical protein